MTNFITHIVEKKCIFVWLRCCIFQANKHSVSGVNVKVRNCKISWLLRIFFRGHFHVHAHKHFSSHSPREGKSSQQNVLPTETWTVYVALNQIYAFCDTRIISDILPPPPHTIKPLGSQSRWSLSHLSVMQASWRWSGSVEESTRYELWDCLNCAVHLRPEQKNLRGNHVLRSSAVTSLISSGLPHHTLLASKNLSLPLARNHLSGLFQIAKAFDCLCFKQCTKAGLSSLWTMLIVWA